MQKSSSAAGPPLDTLLRAGDLVFDVGAHTGAKTDKFLASGCKVVCVEPQPKCVAQLLARFHGDPRVTVVGKGLSDQIASLKMAICAEAPTISTFSEEWQHGRFASYNWGETCTVDVTTLDRLIAEFGMPAFIKIDVEGFEKQVLLGLSRLVPALSFEFTREFKERAFQCVDRLQTLGFSSFNYHRGESDCFASDDWLPAEQLFAEIDRAASEDSDLWGDIFARSDLANVRPQAQPDGFLAELVAKGLWSSGQPLKLHLGCGENHFDGYVNVDYPPSEHTTQTKRGADIYADITRLALPNACADEIRLEHVFEHFPRAAALALLIRWHEWLKPGGVLRLATPDIEGCARQLMSPQLSYETKQAVLRHAFGSHEAAWANHYDGWYAEKYQRVLSALGFKVETRSWQWDQPPFLANVDVSATKMRNLGRQELLAAADRFLADFMVRDVPSEREMHAVWTKQLREQLSHMPDAPAPQTTSPGPSAPLVSIIMAAHNSARYLCESVSSVLAQTFSDWELVVINDGSTDDTADVIRSLVSENPSRRISMLSTADVGPTAARRAGIAHSTGKYILPLDADDRIAPEYLAKTVQVLEANPKLGVVYVDAFTFGDTERLHRQYEYDFRRLCRENFFAYCSLIRRRAYEEVGGHDAENWGYAEDWQLWIRLGAKGWYAQRLAEPLFYYREHPDSSLSFYLRRLAPCYRAFIISRQPEIYSSEERREADQLLAELPPGWHRQPPLRGVARLTAALQENPENRHLLYFLAVAQWQEGQAVAAVQTLQRLLACHPKDKDGLELLKHIQTQPLPQDTILPKTTVFVLTVGDVTFPHCLKALEAQTCRSFKLDIIRNVSPFSAAAQEMFNRCATEYFIQVDEDMILNPDAVARMEEVMEAAPDDVGMVCFYMHDEDREQKIQGVKIHRTRHFQHLRFQDLKASEMDLLEQMARRGVKWIAHPDVMGRHGTLYTPDTIYHRYRTMYEKDIRAWNVVTWDLRKKAAKFQQTGDINQLFALLGAAHGVVNAPHAEDKEKDFRKYNLRALDVFKRLLLEQPRYSSPYDPAGRPQPFQSQPIPFEQVKWKTSVPTAVAPTAARANRSRTSLSVLHTVEFYAPHTGGAEFVVQQISERLVKRGHRVTVATSGHPERTFRELNGVEVCSFAVQGKLAENLVGETARYEQFLRDHPADVMMNYAAQQWATDLAFGVIADTAPRRANVIAPCGYSALVDVQTLRWPHFRDYFEKALPRVLPAYDAVVYHSGIYKDFLLGERLQLRNGVIIPNGTDEEEFTRLPSADFREKYKITTRFFGLCVANFYPAKGQDCLIESVREMNRPDFTMVFIGKEGDQLASLQKQAAGLNVRFLAGIPREDTVAAFRAADLFLFASQIEASPLVILEAKAARLPFVSTDCGNVREWKGGLVCAPNEIATQASRLLDSESERGCLAEEGWREWKDQLTWSAVVDQWEELYLRLHAAKAGAPRMVSTPAAKPAKLVTGVIFSKDRPLQLDGTLRSFFARCKDADQCRLKVLYRASAECQPLYDTLVQNYPNVEFIAEKDFRSDLIHLLSDSEQVLFVVDDNLFIRDFTLAEVVGALRQRPAALGFSLRLGRNTTFCYPLNKSQTLPAFETVAAQTLSYDWPKADCDFNYPLEVSSSVYRTADVLPLLQEMPFKNPNTLEGELAARASRLASRPQLLCFEQSRAFCNPINMVQRICQNRAGGLVDHSPERLAEQFRAGVRLDVEAYKDFRPTGCHQEVALHFDRATLPAGPTVSIVIPCFKQAHYLPDAVQSVLAQTFTDWELIIVNDGSPDDTAAVARGLAARHPDRKIVLLTKPNGGLSDARNAGMRAARGRYLLPLDADDKLAPEFLQATVTLLNGNPEIAVAYTDLQCFEGSTEVIPKGEFGQNLMLENRVAYCALFRREVWETVGGYNANMSAGYEDWDFWVGAVEHGFRGQRIPSNLFLYRVRAQSMITTAMQRHRDLIARIVLNHPRAYDEPSRLRADELLQANPLPAPRVRHARISVVIPCYKQAQFLPESVASVAAQICGDWEIIIVNDGSPDDTSAVAAKLMQNYPGRIMLLEKANGGLSSARNAGIRAAQGEYVFLLDADDRIQPTMLEKTQAVLEKHPKVGFAYTHIQHFGALSNVFPLPDFDRATLISKDNIVCGNCLVRKSAWQQAGGYNELMREGYEDWDFWIGCVERGWEGFCIHEPLFCYRKSATSMLSGANQKRERLIATIVRNHPKLYDAKTKAWADEVLQKAASNLQTAICKPQSVMPLRVTYLINSILGVTGGNQTLLRQADELQRRGHDVTIVTYTPKPDWFTFKMRVVQVPAGQAMAPHVPPSDVVISTYFINTHELLAVKAAVKVYYAQGDQFVFADTTLADTPENRKWRELSRSSYLLPNVRFVPNSRNLARAVEKMTGRKPDGFLPVCTDQTIFRPLQRGLHGSRVRILIVGPDVRGSAAEPLLFKGIQDIHDALHLLAKQHPNFTAVRMSGTPPEIFNRFPCEFHVAPSDEMKTVLFGTADILIYASHYDSCPRPPQEAMAAGCAVVCTATPGAMEYCRDGENCLLVPIQSPQAIADATLRLIQDQALRERVVQGGLATAREFPREREWNELEAMLHRFVQEAKTTPAGPVESECARVPRSRGLGATSAQTEPRERGTLTAPGQVKTVVMPPVGKLGSLVEANALFIKKDYREAWEATLAAIAIRPFHPEAYLLLGEIARAVGDFAQAKACAERAHDMAPKWKPAKKLLKALPGKGKRVTSDWPALPDDSRSRITVCLIVKNEERFLGQCLKSVRDLAHQIVVVDTGSTDRTVEIAKEHGAEVHSFEWCDDFSAARNAALERARGDWVLVLDADEELTAQGRVALRQDMQANAVMAFRLPLFNHGQEADGNCYVPRLFRNAPALFYLGRIHEQVFPSILIHCENWGLETLLGKATLCHYGYTKELTQDRSKVERNLRLLELAVAEWPDEPNLLMNLGLEHVRSGNGAEGLKHYQAAFRLLSVLPSGQVVAELREALLTQLTTQLHKVGDYAEIVRVLNSTLAKSAGLTASLHFALGLAHYELKEFGEAAEQMRQCLAKRHLPALSPINQDVRKVPPHHCLALSLSRAKQPEAAAAAFAAGLKEFPNSRDLRLDWARFQFQHGQAVEALQSLHQLVSEDSADMAVWKLGGDIALSHLDFLEFAGDWTGEAIRHHPQEPALLAQRGESLLLGGDFAGAAEVYRRHVAPKPHDRAALVVSTLLAGQSVPSQNGEEPAVSRALIECYQRWLGLGAVELIQRLNASAATLEKNLPSAARCLQAALAEAGTGQ